MATAIRWGIMGASGIAHAFVTDLQATGFVVGAVGSRSQETADAFAAEHDIPLAYPSYEALLADPGIDIVYVSSPHPFHAEHASLALNAGKHVLVEKPFTLNAAEAAEVAALAAEKNLVVLEAMWTRYLPHMVRLREIIAEGTLGEVRTIIADHNQKLPSDPSHRLQNPDLGGGALLDLGIYPVSFAWDILGEPQTVQAHAHLTPLGVDAQTAIILGYEGGRQALLHTALDAVGPNRASVIGTEARVELDGVFYSPTKITVIASNGDVLEEFEAPVVSRGMQYQAWEAERLITEGLIAGEILSPEESVRIMTTLDDIRAIIGVRYPGE